LGVAAEKLVYDQMGHETLGRLSRSDSALPKGGKKNC